MEVIESECRGVPMLTVAGDIDHDNALLLWAVAERALEGRTSRTLLLDFSDVLYVDSGGLSVLLRLLTTLAPGDWLGLTRPQPMVLNLLHTSGLTAEKSLRLFSSMEGARKAVGPERSQKDGEG